MLQIILFPDNITILFSEKDINRKVDLINTEIKEVTNWFNTNKLSVNASKKICDNECQQENLW